MGQVKESGFNFVEVKQAGTWDPLLQCCNAFTWTDVSLSTKNNCVHVQLGQILDNRYKKTPKAQLPFLKSWEQKQRVGSKSRVLCMCPAHTTTKGVGKPPKPRLQPDPWTHPYPHPIQGTSSPPPSASEQAREPVVCSHSPLLQQGPQ